MAGLGAGNLDRDITLRTAVLVQSASGEASYDWPNADEVEVAAEWFPIGSREAWQAQNRLNTYVDGVFVIHDIDPTPEPDKTRIVFEGREFDIKPPLEIGRDIGWSIPVVARGERQ
jgi:Phage head-tail joining protein